MIGRANTDASAWGRRRLALLAAALLVVPTAAADGVTATGQERDADPAAEPEPATRGPEGVPLGTSTSRQLAWLLEAATRLPVTEAEATAHLSPEYLESVGVVGFNALLAEAAGDAGLRLESFRPTYLREDTQGYGSVTGAGVRRWHLVLVVNESGQVGRLDLRPLPTSWAEIDERLDPLAPEVSFLAAEVQGDGDCAVEHGIDEGVARPMASGFKLYVLGALAHAVVNGTVSWDDVLRVRDDWKADASGPISATPAGTPLTLRDYAIYMMYFSDNSATDHVIRLLGRDTIEAQQRRFGLADPGANEPFLTTREMGQIKGNDYPVHADAYAGLDEAGRRRYLAEVVAPLPPMGEVWDTPRHIDTVEWFGSPLDVCAAFAGLAGQAAGDRGGPVDTVLSLEGTTGLGLGRDDWPRGWFKGGSEPGVMTRNYLATDDDGDTFVVSVMISDPAHDVSTPASTAEIQAIAAGALHLLTAGKT